jgi:hypothetical protein
MRLHALALAAAALIAAGFAAPRAAGGDNVVVATSDRDGGTVFRVSLAVRRANGDVVDDANAAVAVGSDCSGCETVAVALEAVLVRGDPSVFTPANLAIAINVDCDDCATLASAYQWVLQTGGPVHFTADGNRRLARLRHELESLRHADLSVWDVQAAVQALADELADVLSNDLVAAGRS